jgi:acetyl-CoA carboxylase carboxyltransferase component
VVAGNDQEDPARAGDRDASRVPIIYLVDSAGVNLPYQGGVFPGQYGASRIFYYNSIMRSYLKVPQISAVMGPCIAGGAYLPALSDIIIMVEGTSFMGLAARISLKARRARRSTTKRSAARARTTNSREWPTIASQTTTRA